MKTELIVIDIVLGMVSIGTGVYLTFDKQPALGWAVFLIGLLLWSNAYHLGRGPLND